MLSGWTGRIKGDTGIRPYWRRTCDRSADAVLALEAAAPQADAVSGGVGRVGRASLSLISSNVSADGSAGMSDGGSCHAAASDSRPTWTTSETNLRRHSIRLKWRERHGLRRRCEGQRKCNSGQPDHSSLPCVNSSRRDSLEAAHTIRTNAQIRARVSLEMKIHPKFVLHASRAPLPASPKPSTLPSSAETAPSPPRRPT